MELTPAQLRALCVWREAQNQPFLGKSGVAHVIENRCNQPGWWGHDNLTVVLCPWQFSSFNKNDPNSKKWPTTLEESEQPWQDSMRASLASLGGEPDPTDGAQYYHDTSMGWPSAWGEQSGYTQTLSVGQLLFYRHN